MTIVMPVSHPLTMSLRSGCENAQLVSALNSDDAGTQNIGNVFTNGFPADLVNAAFGGNVAGASTAANMDPIGTGSNWGLSECLKQCGIQPNGTSYIKI